MVTAKEVLFQVLVVDHAEASRPLPHSLCLLPGRRGRGLRADQTVNRVRLGTGPDVRNDAEQQGRFVLRNARAAAERGAAGRKGDRVGAAGSVLDDSLEAVPDLASL